MFEENSYGRRRALAEEIRGRRDETAELVTDRFLERHPAWLETYGDRARLHGVRDAAFHVDFLAAAIEAGSLDAIRDYGAWSARVLGARGIERSFLVENLEQVRDVLVAGLAGEGRAWVEAMAAAACDGATAPERPAADSDSPARPDDVLAEDRRVYMEAALSGHRATAVSAALDCLRRGLSVPDVYHDLIQPVQYEIGRLWEINEISVAREHMATAITQHVIAHMHSGVERPEERKGRVVVTGVEGEVHQIGASMVADVLEATGWDVRFLGTELPRRDILRTVEEYRPHVVGISATMLYNLPAVAALIADSRRLFGHEIRVVVGGRAFRRSPGAWRDLGADAFGKDLRDALRVTEALAGDGG